VNHLEQLLFEYYEWNGFIVKSNVFVGKRSGGGWEGEIDIACYNPYTNELLQFEPSLDAQPWVKREKRFSKKFEVGRQYIKTEVFPWLTNSDIVIQQFAVLS